MEEATELKPPQAAKEGSNLRRAHVCSAETAERPAKGRAEKIFRTARRPVCLVLLPDNNCPASGRSPPNKLLKEYCQQRTVPANLN